MALPIKPRGIDTAEKLRLMQEDARFDIAHSSEAGVTPDLGFLRDTVRAPVPLPKVPKVFLANDCIFNCAYCTCRQTNDCRRYLTPPRELAELSVRQATRNGHGIFISSAIYQSPDVTQELMVETLKLIRGEWGYGGYVHAKVMPGADERLIRETGLYANRLSVNIEVAKNEGFARVAKQKNRANILTPMGQISRLIQAARQERSPNAPFFASSQSTQMMAGAAEEDDLTILRLSGALYRKYKLRRVYYTAFHYQRPAKGYSLPLTQTPAWRMRRLYQADRLMQLYGFSAEEITPESDPLLSADMDPKIAWALRNLHLFPIEINRADYETLLRIPGLGITYAKRILEAKKYGPISHQTLSCIGVSVKRCQHFITCQGRYVGRGVEDADCLTKLLRDPPETPVQQLSFSL